MPDGDDAILIETLKWMGRMAADPHLRYIRGLPLAYFLYF